VNARVQRLCVWCTLVGLLLVFVALLVATWFPLPAPHHSAAYVGRFYRDHVDGIRLGSVLLTAGAALLAPLAAVLAVHLRRIEGEFSPLAYLELGMGSASPLAISITAFFWWTAAFRPGRDPVVTQSWNDAGWLCFTAVVFIVIVQLGAVALAIFTDKRAQPLFPRWLGYLSAWTALLLIPSVLCLWFKRGPFAWNGVATLYLAFVVFGAWIIAMMVNLLRVISELEAEVAAPPR
jgi:hypothetical protein